MEYIVYYNDKKYLVLQFVFTSYEGVKAIITDYELGGKIFEVPIAELTYKINKPI
jgi:hypothetical protein